MDKHGDHLSPTVLKKIPELLNNPVVITEYTGPNGDVKNTVNVYGDLFVGDKPVVVGVVMRLDSTGQGTINNIRTIHARSNFAKQITDESTLYLNEDKKKTRKWFQVCGNLNVPLDGTRFGLIRSISFDDESVNAKASKKSRAQLDEYISKYGAIPKGERPARDIQMPRQTGDNEKLSQMAPKRQKRTAGRASGTLKQFAELYRAKTNPNATDDEVKRQYERFKQFARDYDVVESSAGFVSRRELNELFDKVLELRERAMEHRTNNPETNRSQLKQDKEWEIGVEQKRMVQPDTAASWDVIVVKQIGKSVGAKAKNYKVHNPITGEHVPLTEGTRITQPKNHIMAGKGRNRQIDEIGLLVDRYGGDPLEWTKEKGFGYVDDEYGESHCVELHWYQEPSFGICKMKIKI